MREEGGEGVAGSAAMSTAVQRSPTKLWRSNFIVNLWCPTNLPQLTVSSPMCLVHINMEFFGPQMARAYRLDAVSQGPKNSLFPGPTPPLSCPRNVSARIKHITHGAIQIIGA
jgi:hypothetical protein